MDTLELIKKECKIRKIPISKLERECGFSNGYIRNLKTGKIPADRLQKIADFLNLPYAYFLENGWTVKEGTFGGIENIMPELSITKKERALLVAFRNADDVTKKNICKILEVPDDEV